MNIMKILRKPGVSSTMRRWAVPASAILFVAVFLGFSTSGLSSFGLPAILKSIRGIAHETLGAVASAGDVCSRVGTTTMQRGGNAVDAALATDFCLGVTHMWIAGLGGGGYAIIRDSTGKTECVDFRETAPAASNRDMYNNNPNASTVGGLASGVPGELRGMEYIHKRYGKLSWEAIIQPALGLARNGFTINTLLYSAMTDAIKDNGGENFFVNNADWAKIFAPNGTMLGVGDTVLMEDYANLLESVAINSADAFYTGPIAAKIANQVQASGGILTTKDLQAYDVKTSTPLEITYGDYKIKACHATSGGSIVLSTMNTFQQFPGRDNSQNMNVSLHRLVEAMRFGYAMRATLGDPDFNEGQTDSEFKFVQTSTAVNISKMISDSNTLPIEAYNPDQLDIIHNHGTSHLSAADSSGMAISLTSTPNLHFGSRLMISGLGLVMNNEMDDFSVPNRSNHFGYIPTESNYIAPFKRPLSSMAPVIVDHSCNDSFYAATGGAGGSHIISGVEQTLWRLLDLKFSAKQAINASRFHDQLIPNVLNLEDTWGNETYDYLKKLGHDVQWGNVGVDLHVVLMLSNGTFEAAAESRLEGSGGFAV